MKNLHTYTYLLLLSILPFLNACTDDTPEPAEGEPVYRNGILVVNQGNFSSADGSLDFYDPAEEVHTINVYQKANQEPIGGIIEDVAFHAGKAIIISNAADKVIIADENSLVEVATIEDAELATPRYFAGSGSKGYISVWGPYEDDWSLQNSRVAVLDLSSNTLASTIEVPAGPEGIVSIGNKVFVANSFTDTISVIDTQTDALIKKIKTHPSPSHFAVDANGQLWVVYGSGYIARINPFTYEEEKTIEISDKSLSGKIQLVGNTLYFHTSQWDESYTNTSNAIYKVDITAASPEAALVLEKENMRTFRVDAENGNIYGGISLGAESGTIVVFDQQGQETGNFAAGKFPHQIIFR
jgi:YVTN family beta-propeller protein